MFFSFRKIFRFIPLRQYKFMGNSELKSIQCGLSQMPEPDEMTKFNHS